MTKATAVAGLNAQQHIECMLEGALIFNRLGMRRKYGFFLYATVLLCIECDNFSFAQSLVSFFVDLVSSVLLKLLVLLMLL